MKVVKLFLIIFFSYVVYVFTAAYFKIILPGMNEKEEVLKALNKEVEDLDENGIPRLFRNLDEIDDPVVQKFLKEYDQNKIKKMHRFHKLVGKYRAKLAQNMEDEGWIFWYLNLSSLARECGDEILNVYPEGEWREPTEQELFNQEAARRLGNVEINSMDIGAVYGYSSWMGITSKETEGCCSIEEFERKKEFPQICIVDSKGIDGMKINKKNYKDLVKFGEVY